MTTTATEKARWVLGSSRMEPRTGIDRIINSFSYEQLVSKHRGYNWSTTIAVHAVMYFLNSILEWQTELTNLNNA